MLLRLLGFKRIFDGISLPVREVCTSCHSRQVNLTMVCREKIARYQSVDASETFARQVSVIPGYRNLHEAHHAVSPRKGVPNFSCAMSFPSTWTGLPAAQWTGHPSSNAPLHPASHSVMSCSSGKNRPLTDSSNALISNPGISLTRDTVVSSHRPKTFETHD